MGRESHQIQAKRKCFPFERIQIRLRITFHLNVQQLDAIEAHVGGQFDALIHRQVVGTAELKKRIR